MDTTTTTPTSLRRVACKVRLTNTGVAVTSPRTGVTLCLSHDKAPRRLRGRIVQAISVCRHDVEFTLDELREFKNAAQAA